MEAIAQFFAAILTPAQRHVLFLVGQWGSLSAPLFSDQETAVVRGLTASDMGLIYPEALAGRWYLTVLGKAVIALLVEEEVAHA